MKFYFVRHGETDWNVMKHIQGQTDTELNSKGISQAYETAEKIAAGNYGITEIYSSRQKRAVKTAEIIGEKLGIVPVIKPGLEEMTFGDWEGHSWTDVKEIFKDHYELWVTDRRYTRTPNGESYNDVLMRVISALKEIAAGKPEGNVLIASHSAVIRILLTYVNGQDFNITPGNLKIRNGEIFEVDSTFFED